MDGDQTSGRGCENGRICVRNFFPAYISLNNHVWVLSGTSGGRFSKKFELESLLLVLDMISSHLNLKRMTWHPRWPHYVARSSEKRYHNPQLSLACHYRMCIGSDSSTKNRVVALNPTHSHPNPPYPASCRCCMSSEIHPALRALQATDGRDRWLLRHHRHHVLRLVMLRISWLAVVAQF